MVVVIIITTMISYIAVNYANECYFKKRGQEDECEKHLIYILN